MMYRLYKDSRQLSREGRRACVTAFLSFYLVTPATTSIWVFGTPKSDEQCTAVRQRHWWTVFQCSCSCRYLACQLFPFSPLHFPQRKFTLHFHATGNKCTVLVNRRQNICITGIAYVCRNHSSTTSLAEIRWQRTRLLRCAKPERSRRCLDTPTISGRNIVTR